MKNLFVRPVDEYQTSNVIDINDIEDALTKSHKMNESLKSCAEKGDLLENQFAGTLNPIIQNSSSETLEVINDVNAFLKLSIAQIKSEQQGPAINAEVINGYHWITKCINNALNYEINKINQDANRSKFNAKMQRQSAFKAS